MASRETISFLSIPSDSLCLDFVNTRTWRGTDAPSEALSGIEDVLAWIGASAPSNGKVLTRFGTKWRTQPADGAAAFAGAIGLREILHRVFASVAAQAAIDLSSLNIALQQAAPRHRLVCEGGVYGWEVEEMPASAAGLLSPVLWSAADLLAGAHTDKVRQCANPRCGVLFLDDSKAGKRRWCSMSACGNRAKAQRHYQRHKAS